MKKPKLRELVEAVKAIFTGPYTPKEFLKPAENLRGQAKFFEDDCIGCVACAEVCPAGCIKVEDDLEHDPPVRRLTVWTDQCIVCGQCERYCTTKKGIRLTPDYDLATFEAHKPRVSVEKELMLCERCGEATPRPADGPPACVSSASDRRVKRSGHSLCIFMKRCTQTTNATKPKHSCRKEKWPVCASTWKTKANRPPT